MASLANVVVLVGSLRKESLNRKMVEALIALNIPHLKFEIVDIGNLPLYNQDLETEHPPAEWVSFRQKIKSADSVFFVSPEYNRSMSGSMKNALDVGSRPYGKNSFDAKPGAVMTVSPGALGAFGANHHIRQSLVFLNVPAMQQPEAYIGGADKMFDAAGKLTNDSTREFLEKFGKAFADWIEKNRKPSL